MEKLAVMVAMIVTRGRSHMSMKSHMHSNQLASYFKKATFLDRELTRNHRVF